MTKEKFKYYMGLYECAKKLWVHKLIEHEAYEEICTLILEKMHQEYVKGDPLDKCY